MCSQGSKSSPGGHRRLRSDCLDAPDALCLHWAHIQYCRKCAPAHISAISFVMIWGETFCAASKKKALLTFRRISAHARPTNTQVTTTSLQRRYSDVITTLLGRSVFAGRPLSLATCLVLWWKLPLDLLSTWANSVASCDTVQMRRLALTFTVIVCYSSSFPMTRLLVVTSSA